MSISIHAAREGGDLDKNVKGFVSGISIHAAREGGDHGVWLGSQSAVISIHAAREGGDWLLGIKAASKTNFNPRRP